MLGDACLDGEDQPVLESDAILPIPKKLSIPEAPSHPVQKLDAISMQMAELDTLHPDRRRQAIGGSFVILLGAAINYRLKESPTRRTWGGGAAHRDREGQGGGFGPASAHRGWDDMAASSGEDRPRHRYGRSRRRLLQRSRRRGSWQPMRGPCPQYMSPTLYADRLDRLVCAIQKGVARQLTARMS